MSTDTAVSGKILKSYAFRRHLHGLSISVHTEAGGRGGGGTIQAWILC